MKLYSQLLIGFYIIMLTTSCNKSDQHSQLPESPLTLIKGVDASYIPQIRASGIISRNRAGQAEDMLTTLQKEGVTTIRLRLWKDPANGHSGFQEVKTFSDEIRQKGMKIWLTVHYSDTWADPGHQYKPEKWSGISYAQLKDSVYAYTKKVMAEIAPDYIQIGNEINGGLLWPEGSWNNRSQMLELVQEGVKAVREGSTTTQIMLHYAGYQQAAPFFEHFRQTDYDLIALSYYPLWHGKDLNDLQTRLPQLALQFGKEVVLAETAYPFTFGWNDWTTNIIGSSDQILPQFPASPQGQKAFLQHIHDMAESTDGLLGYCYWGGEWIAFKGPQASDGTSWENQALWDFQNRAVPAMEVFND
jgi:arabinogalactan endo-1,4-beta-galactosidase